MNHLIFVVFLCESFDFCCIFYFPNSDSFRNQRRVLVEVTEGAFSLLLGSGRAVYVYVFVHVHVHVYVYVYVYVYAYSYWGTEPRSPKGFLNCGG